MENTKKEETPESTTTELPEDPEKKVIDNIGPADSITEGVFYSIFVWFIISAPIYLYTEETTVNLYGSLVCGFLAALIFFSKGFNTPVKTAHLGAIKFADERIYTRQLIEGWVWLFPFLYTYQEVLAKEITVTIGSDDKPLEILAVGSKHEGDEEGSGGIEKTDDEKKDVPRDIVQLSGKILVRLVIWNAPISLGYEYSLVEKNIVNYINSTLRQIASDKGYLEFVTNKHEIANSVFRSFKRMPHEADGGEMKTYSQQVEDMGYRIIDIEFVKVDLPKSVKEAAEKRNIEESHRQSEMTEVGTYERISAKLKAQNPDLSDTEISNRTLLLMGKPINIYEGVGGNMLIQQKDGGKVS